MISPVNVMIGLLMVSLIHFNFNRVFSGPLKSHKVAMKSNSSCAVFYYSSDCAFASSQWQCENALISNYRLLFSH